MTVIVHNGIDHQARRISCEGFMQGFDANVAAIEQKQRYAECVDMLYPTEPMPKGIIAFLLICGVIGAVWAWRAEQDLVMSFMGFLVGPVVGFLALMVLAAVWYVLS